MIVIIDYKAGNLKSIQNMLERIGFEAIISNEPSDIQKAAKLILPGVGSFDYGMDQLNQSGLIETLNEQVLKQKTPILGICLGLQLMTRKSEEGSLPGLGWLDAETIAFNKQKLPNDLKIPHMGWNEIEFKQDSILLKGFHELPPRFYFVHSYHLVTENKSQIMATTNYGYEIVIGMQRDNIFGVQFHPEKSHKFGMQFLKNFATL